jgi:hypothetical protein
MWAGTCSRWDGEQRVLRGENILHILIQNKTKKPLAKVLNG